MVDLDALTVQSLRHYQLGRLRMSLRIAIVLLPIAAACLVEPVGRETALCCAVVLLVGCVWLRFQSRAGVESVTTGLLAGGIPLAALLLLSQVDPGCAAAGAISYCTAFSLLVGAVGGALVALRERARASVIANWPFTVGIAVMTAGLGCARLGIAGIAGVTLGMILSRASARSGSAR